MKPRGASTHETDGPSALMGRVCCGHVERKICASPGLHPPGRVLLTVLDGAASADAGITPRPVSKPRPTTHAVTGMDSEVGRHMTKLRPSFVTSNI